MWWIALVIVAGVLLVPVGSDERAYQHLRRLLSPEETDFERPTEE